MPKLGLGLSLPQTRAAGGFTPKKLSGLSLWLKADAGVSQNQSQYVSKIVLSNSSVSSYNGTYNALSEPDADLAYSLESSNGTIIYFNGPSNGGEYYLFDNPYLSCYYSNDGINWSATGSVRPSTITINNANVSGANGTYTYFGWNGDAMVWVKGTFYIECYPGDNFILGNGDTGQNLYRSTQFFGQLPTGAWTNFGAGGTCTSTAVSFPTGAAPAGATTISKYGPVNVNQWSDQSGNNFVFTPYFSGQATVNPTVIHTGINNKRSISFLNSLMLSNNANIGNNGLTIFIVGYSRGQLNGGGDLQSYINLSDLASQDFDAWQCAAYGGPNTDFQNNAWMAVDDGTTYAQLTYPHAIDTPRIITYLCGSGTLSGFVNGDLINSVSAPNAQLLGRPMGIGNRSIVTEGSDPGSRENLNGVISEIIIYNRKLNTGERQQVEAYLNTKYAIY